MSSLKHNFFFLCYKLSAVAFTVQSHPMMCSPLGSLGTRSVQTMMDHVGAPERSPTGTALYYDAKLMKACSLFYTCSCMCLRMCKLFPKCFSALILNFTQNAIRTSIVDAVTAPQRKKACLDSHVINKNSFPGPR